MIFFFLLLLTLLFVVDDVVGGDDDDDDDDAVARVTHKVVVRKVALLLLREEIRVVPRLGRRERLRAWVAVECGLHVVLRATHQGRVCLVLLLGHAAKAD